MLEIEALQGQNDCFLSACMQKGQLANPVPTKGFLHPSADKTNQFHPLGEPTSLPLSHPFYSHITYLPRTLPLVTA